MLSYLKLFLYHKFNRKSLDERLPNTDIDVEEVDRRLQVSPQATLLLVAVQLNFEVGEVC